ncbi:EAL domain-containing protein [Xylophilus sp. Kf1]|nr:EAL domain-containing protein [Xylophilus sp. Kf1]
MFSRGPAFVRSKIGKKIFLTFLLIIAVPLVSVSLLSSRLSDYVLTKATDQLLRDSTKSIALNLLDRLRSAEAMLRILHTSQIAHTDNRDAIDRGKVLFSEVRLENPTGDTLREKPQVRVRSTPGAEWPEVSMEIDDPASGKRVVGVLHHEYLWENLESALFTLCVGGAEFAEPHCQGPPRPQVSTIEVERPFYFRPYFEGQPWTLLAVASPDVADYLPIRMSELFSYVAAVALLMTLSVSAFFIRRATTPLDALINATHAIRNRNFAHVVETAGMKDEFRDVAESFNVMSATIGGDISFMQALARIDVAILGQQSLDSIIRISFDHLSHRPEFKQLQLTVVDYLQEQNTVYRIAARSQVTVFFQTIEGNTALLATGPKTSPPDRESTGGLVAKTDTLAAFLERPAGPDAPSTEGAAQLDAFKSRIAVAIHAQEHEKILVARAARDSLTKLLNRLGLVERLDDMIAAAPKDKPGLAVVYLDLDGFKEVNDAYGHDTGDKLLKMVADRMAAALFGRQASIARLGGDEFVFVLPIVEEESMKKQVQSVLHELQLAYAIDELQIQIGASLGVAVYPDDGSGHDDLLRHADLAMYAAKAQGRNSVVYFEASLNSASAEKIELRRDLAEAITGNQLHLVYQPRVACSDLSNRSAEALLRWTHPTRGNVPPDKFITLAEESGLIIDIGYWVLREAIAQLGAWRRSGDVSIEKISVNLSPIQLMNDGFMETVEQIMAHGAVSATSIELEVTEGALIQDIDTAVRKLKRLRELGFTIALDDFGVGYSAMSYLSVLPFDTLKIDKSFVSGFGIQPSAYAIASAIVALAKALDKQVVAEGVETQEQATALIRLGVEELQGYFYSKPLKPQDLVTYLASAAQRV